MSKVDDKLKAALEKRDLKQKRGQLNKKIKTLNRIRALEQSTKNASTWET
jgi:hypothetical protein